MRWITLNAIVMTNLAKNLILIPYARHCKGAFTNYVYKRRGGRWSKKSTFYKLLYHRKCKRRGVGGQKKPNLVNVVCEHPLDQLQTILDQFVKFI